MFGKKKAQAAPLQYDPSVKKPVLRCSICNGEQVAGLKNRNTGEFEEIMLIRNEQDLDQFRKMTGTEDIPKEY